MKNGWEHFLVEFRSLILIHIHIPLLQSKSLSLLTSMNQITQWHSVSFIWCARHLNVFFLLHLYGFVYKYLQDIFRNLLNHFGCFLSLDLSVFSSFSYSPSIYLHCLPLTECVCIYAIFRTLAHKHPLEFVHTIHPHIHSHILVRRLCVCMCVC